ncbi:tripartite tricarboxylate transporter TctB family protein [Massilia sp. Mn16-1_5]|uniref:tripartite tricarboxylate transporter TctB family protein n=1 Tax=Massilia sp. Mn16-1_5 TaxID=2079199 RepID=UPI00109E8D5A|nr:tripartite tricarboxylate transporter TctB family protein [Massilia sp. Mn16-1_5]THC45341.1 small permease of tripartite tricarboxylate transporter [Massilia sp. Mn16-1_5]
MPSFIRHPKDFWTGIIFLFIGLAAIIIGRDYPMGSAGRMGPAYFPTVLGGMLALIGLIGVIRSFLRPGEAIGKFYIKEIVLILVAVLLFGFLVRGAGLVPAALVLILMSAYASPKFTWGASILLAVGLAVFAVVVFVKLLGLPMPILGPWLGFN